MALSLLHTYAFSCHLHGFWALIWVFLIIKAPKSKAGCLNKLLAYLLWNYFTCPPHPYIESQSTDSLIEKYVHNSRQSNSQKQQQHTNTYTKCSISCCHYVPWTYGQRASPTSKQVYYHHNSVAGTVIASSLCTKLNCLKCPELLIGLGPCINNTHNYLAHDFSIKLSPCMCSHILLSGGVTTTSKLETSLTV